MGPEARSLKCSARGQEASPEQDRARRGGTQSEVTDGAKRRFGAGNARGGACAWSRSVTFFLWVSGSFGPGGTGSSHFPAEPMAEAPNAQNPALLCVIHCGGSSLSQAGSQSSKARSWRRGRTKESLECGWRARQMHTAPFACVWHTLVRVPAPLLILWWPWATCFASLSSEAKKCITACPPLMAVESIQAHKESAQPKLGKNEMSQESLSPWP